MRTTRAAAGLMPLCVMVHAPPCSLGSAESELAPSGHSCRLPMANCVQMCKAVHTSIHRQCSHAPAVSPEAADQCQSLPAAIASHAKLEQRMMLSADGVPPAQPFQALRTLLQQLPPDEDALPCASAFSERINGQLVGCLVALPSIPSLGFVVGRSPSVSELSSYGVHRCTP